MNLRQTAEVAALVSSRAEAFIQHHGCPSPEVMHSFWKASRVRLSCWFAGLRTLPTVLDMNHVPAPYHVRECVGVARSILVAELLTRVWCAALASRDAVRSNGMNEQLVSDVLRGQAEARNEVMRLLADETRIPAPEATMLDRLRKRVECWTDRLLSTLVLHHDISRFAFEIERCREAASIGNGLLQTSDDAVHPLTLLGLSRAIPSASGRDHLVARLDRSVAQTVVSCLAYAESSVCPPESHHEHRHGETMTDDHPHGSPDIPSPSTGLRFADLRRRRSCGEQRDS